MPIRFPDQFPSFREVDGLSDTAFRLYVTAFFWCSVNQTDGLITREDLDLVSARVRASERFAAECERRGAWHDARHDCGSEFCTGPFDADGWVVHDYLRYAPSKAEAQAEGSAKSKGGRRGNHKKWHEDRGIKAPGCEFCHSPASAAPPAPKRTSHKRSHTDRMSDSHATPISRSDFDSDQSSPGQSVKSGTVTRARGPEPGTPEFRLQVQAEMALRVPDEVDDATADFIAADVLGKASKPVTHKLRFVLKAITDEAEPRARWLPRRPPVAILAEFSPALGPHEFEYDPETGGCTRCKEPKPDKIHRAKKAAVS